MDHSGASLHSPQTPRHESGARQHGGPLPLMDNWAGQYLLTTLTFGLYLVIIILFALFVCFGKNIQNLDLQRALSETGHTTFERWHGHTHLLGPGRSVLALVTTSLASPSTTAHTPLVTPESIHQIHIHCSLCILFCIHCILFFFAENAGKMRVWLGGNRSKTW